MVATSLLSNFLLALAIAIAAKPVLEQKSPMKLPLTELRAGSFTKHNIVERDSDRGRENSLMRRAGITSVVVEANYTAALIFSVVIYLGDPPHPYNLMVDTGSSNTWVTEEAYVVTSTSQATNEAVSQTYGSGKFSGKEYYDILTLGTVAFNQSIGVASQKEGFDNLGVDGFLGIGPTDLTIGTLSPDKDQAIPTINDNLSQLLGLQYLVVALKPFGTIGQIIWGGIESIDSTLFIGDITFGPMTTTFPDNKEWGIDFSLGYGDLPLLTNAAGILDTGSALIYLTSDAYNAYRIATGAVLDPITGLLAMPFSQFNSSNFLDLNILFGNPEKSFTLKPDAQIFPRDLNTHFGGITQQVYLVVSDIGNLKVKSMIILGAPFAERFLLAVGLTSTNKQIGIAYTPDTLAISNSVITQ